MIFVPDTIIGTAPGSRFTAFASLEPNYNELLDGGILPNELLAHFIRYEPFPCSIDGVLGLFPDVSVYQCDSEVLEAEAGPVNLKCFGIGTRQQNLSCCRASKFLRILEC